MFAAASRWSCADWALCTIHPGAVRGLGVKTYGGLTVLGTLLIATASTVAIWWHASAWVTWLTAS